MNYQGQKEQAMEDVAQNPIYVVTGDIETPMVEMKTESGCFVYTLPNIRQMVGDLFRNPKSANATAMRLKEMMETIELQLGLGMEQVMVRSLMQDLKSLRIKPMVKEETVYHSMLTMIFDKKSDVLLRQYAMRCLVAGFELFMKVRTDRKMAA